MPTKATGQRRRKFTARHGTNAGYQQHRLAGKNACAACKVAHRKYAEEQRRKEGMTKRGPVAEHGTRSAYERERKAYKAGTGPEPCEACREANRHRGGKPITLADAAETASGQTVSTPSA